MRDMQTEPAEETTAHAERPRFVQYLFFQADPHWRRLPEEQRCAGRREFAQVVEQTREIKTFAYSTLGLKVDADLMLWRIADSLECLQEMLSGLLQTGLGQYLRVTEARRYTSKDQPIFTAIHRPLEEALALLG